MSNEFEKYPQYYLDKNGNKIKAGMTIRMDDGSIERVYAISDANGNPDLGINASNMAFLESHPDWSQEFYSLSTCNVSTAEICLDFSESREEKRERSGYRDRDDVR